MNASNNLAIQEDEIDLRELFKTIVKNKKIIIFTTLIVTLAAIVYVIMKNPIPIYQGKAIVEIGEIQNENFGIKYFDEPNNLSVIVSNQFEDISVSTLKGTNKLIEITASNTDKELIKTSINSAVSFVLDRHKEKADFHTRYIMSKQIGKIDINDTPINKPKKSLIVTVAFVTGFILSIFLVFFLEFIRNEKDHQLQ